jgi:hypothetical protein
MKRNVPNAHILPIGVVCSAGDSARTFGPLNKSRSAGVACAWSGGGMTSKVFRSRNRRRCYSRVGKPFESPFAAHSALENLGCHTLSLYVLGKLLREAITGSGKGHFHACDGAFVELIHYHGHMSCSCEEAMVDGEHFNVCAIAYTRVRNLSWNFAAEHDEMDGVAPL